MRYCCKQCLFVLPEAFHEIAIQLVSLNHSKQFSKRNIHIHIRLDRSNIGGAISSHGCKQCKTFKSFNTEFWDKHHLVELLSQWKIWRKVVVGFFFNICFLSYPVCFESSNIIRCVNSPKNTFSNGMCKWGNAFEWGTRFHLGILTHIVHGAMLCSFVNVYVAMM